MGGSYWKALRTCTDRLIRAAKFPFVRELIWPTKMVKRKY